MQLQAASTFGLAHFKKREMHYGELERQSVYSRKTTKKGTTNLLVETIQRAASIAMNVACMCVNHCGAQIRVSQ